MTCNCNEDCQFKAENPMTPNEAVKLHKYKINGVLKDKFWNSELERYLFVRNDNVVASKSKEVEFEDVNYWNISAFVQLAYDSCPFSKVTIELV